MGRQQLDELTLLFRRHDRPRRMMQRGHEPACPDGMRADCLAQGGQVNAFCRMRRNLNHVTTEPFGGLQATVESRRFDGDGIARTSHRLQCKVQSLECARGDNDLLYAYGHSEV